MKAFKFIDKNTKLLYTVHPSQIQRIVPIMDYLKIEIGTKNSFQTFETKFIEKENEETEINSERKIQTT